MTTLTIRGSRVAKLAPWAIPKGSKLKKDGTHAAWTVPSNTSGSQYGPGASCVVEATAACVKVCYVKKSHKPTLNLLDANHETVQTLATEQRWPELAHQYYDLLNTSYCEQVEFGITDPLYRINWAGGILNEWHARAINWAVRAVPNLSTWIFTRNFWVLPDLLKNRPANLRVLLSADEDNYLAAELIAGMYNLQIAYMGDTPQRGQRTLNCPGVKRHVVKTRKSPTGYAGICAACRACVDNDARPDIRFAIH